MTYMRHETTYTGVGWWVGRGVVSSKEEGQHQEPIKSAWCDISWQHIAQAHEDKEGLPYGKGGIGETGVHWDIPQASIIGQ